MVSVRTNLLPMLSRDAIPRVVATKRMAHSKLLGHIKGNQTDFSVTYNLLKYTVPYCTALDEWPAQLWISYDTYLFDERRP